MGVYIYGKVARATEQGGGLLDEPADRVLPPYNFASTAEDPRASSRASSGLKNTTKVANTVTKAPIRRCKAAEPVVFGLDMPILQYEMRGVS